MTLPVHNMMAYARSQGAPWEEIDKALATEQQAHLAAGGSFWEMVNKLGFRDPKLLHDRLRTERIMDLANERE